MTKQEFINKEMNVWGENYVFDLIDRGYEPVELVVNDKLRWWWRYNGENTSLTQANICATMPESRSVVSPVSTEMLTLAD